MLGLLRNVSKSTFASASSSSSSCGLRAFANVTSGAASSSAGGGAGAVAESAALTQKEAIQRYRRALKIAERVKVVKANPLADVNKKIGKHPLRRMVRVILTNGATW